MSDGFLVALAFGGLVLGLGVLLLIGFAASCWVGPLFDRYAEWVDSIAERIRP